MLLDAVASSRGTRPTRCIAFHQNHYRNFKHFYLDYVTQHWNFAFPKLPSYQRFVEWMPSTLIPLCVYLKRCFGHPTGIGFVDATSLKVCQHGGWTSCLRSSVPHRHNRRIKRHKVFDGLAQRGKTSVDWFFGFKLHLVVNEIGQLLNAQLTPGNINDRRPIPELLQNLFGEFFADRGYVSQKLANQLLEEFGINFFAKPRRNMKNKLMRLHDKLLSRQRSIIETINDQLKNISQIEHSRHRSPVNFCVNVLCGLIAYCEGDPVRVSRTWERARTRRVINLKNLAFVLIGFYLNLQRPELRFLKTCVGKMYFENWI